MLINRVTIVFIVLIQFKINCNIVTMTNWLPDISKAQSTKYLALADEIGSAIKDGILPAGAKMPPQRNLAYDIGVTLGTVSRGYREAERRGLIGGEVGRGTYVLDLNSQQEDSYFIPGANLPTGVANFSHGSPVKGQAGKYLAKIMADISLEPNIDALCNYQLNTGMDVHVEAGATWLTYLGLENAHTDNIAITNGAQHGIMVSLMAVSSPGDTILVDPLTYPGVIHLAKKLGYRLETVANDEHGMIPDALDEACRRHAPSVLFLMPTLQNPTVTSMPTDRRLEIAKIVKKSGLFVIEDDSWGPMVDTNAPQMANLIPDQTFYLTSFSKCIAGGMRIGYVLGPPRLSDRLRAAVRMTCMMPAPLMAEIIRRWIMDGTTQELITWQRAQVDKRSTAALNSLKGHQVNYYPGSHLIWLSLPEPWTAREFKSQAEDRGIIVISADTFAIDRLKAPQAVRIGIGHPENIEAIIKGANKLADILEQGPEDSFNVI